MESVHRAQERSIKNGKETQENRASQEWKPRLNVSQAILARGGWDK